MKNTTLYVKISDSIKYSRKELREEINKETFYSFIIAYL